MFNLATSWVTTSNILESRGRGGESSIFPASMETRCTFSELDNSNIGLSISVEEAMDRTSRSWARALERAGESRDLQPFKGQNHLELLYNKNGESFGYK